MESFENWTNTTGGILESVGVEGFLGNRSTFTVQSDTDRDTIRGLVADWHKSYGTKAVKAR